MFYSYDSFSLYYLIPYVHKLEMLSKSNDIGVKLLLGLIWPELNFYNVYFLEPSLPCSFTRGTTALAPSTTFQTGMQNVFCLNVCLFLDHDLLKVQKVIYCDQTITFARVCNEGRKENRFTSYPNIITSCCQCDESVVGHSQGQAAHPSTSSGGFSYLD